MTRSLSSSPAARAAGLGEARDGLVHELQVVLDGLELLTGGLHVGRVHDARFGQVLVQELGAEFRLLVEDFRHHLLEVDDFDALAAHELGERVVLLLRDLQEWNVVKEQSFQLERRQIQQLIAGTMKADLLQLPDLAGYMDTAQCNPPFSICIFSFSPGTPSPVGADRT